jgi:hypothetical protein
VVLTISPFIKLFVEIIRGQHGIVKVRLGLHLWNADGQLEYSQYYFYAFRHAEAAANKALNFLKDIDKEFDKRRDSENHKNLQ